MNDCVCAGVNGRRPVLSDVGVARRRLGADPVRHAVGVEAIWPVAMLSGGSDVPSRKKSRCRGTSARSRAAPPTARRPRCHRHLDLIQCVTTGLAERPLLDRLASHGGGASSSADPCQVAPSSWTTRRPAARRPGAARRGGWRQHRRADGGKTSSSRSAGSTWRASGALSEARSLVGQRSGAGSAASAAARTDPSMTRRSTSTRHGASHTSGPGPPATARDCLGNRSRTACGFQRCPQC